MSNRTGGIALLIIKTLILAFALCPVLSANGVCAEAATDILEIQTGGATLTMISGAIVVNYIKDRPVEKRAVSENATGTGIFLSRYVTTPTNNDTAIYDFNKSQTEIHEYTKQIDYILANDTYNSIDFIGPLFITKEGNETVSFSKYLYVEFKSGVVDENIRNELFSKYNAAVHWHSKVIDVYIINSNKKRFDELILLRESLFNENIVKRVDFSLGGFDDVTFYPNDKFMNNEQ